MDGTKDTVLLFLEVGVEDEVTKYDYDPANAVSEFSTGCESETSRRHPPVSHQVNIDKTYHNNGGSLPPPECRRGGGNKGQKRGECLGPDVAASVFVKTET